MTKSEIYKAISDLIADSDGASIDYIIGVNDMGRYLAEQCKDAPSPEPQHQISEEWMDKLIEMVKQGNEAHLEFTPEETRIEVMPWKPFEYKCPYKGDKEC